MFPPPMWPGYEARIEWYSSGTLQWTKQKLVLDPPSLHFARTQDIAGAIYLVLQ